MAGVLEGEIPERRYRKRVKMVHLPRYGSKSAESENGKTYDDNFATKNKVFKLNFLYQEANDLTYY